VKEIVNNIAKNGAPRRSILLSGHRMEYVDSDSEEEGNHADKHKEAIAEEEDHEDEIFF
jgi:hypothetical protein